MDKIFYILITFAITTGCTVKDQASHTPPPVTDPFAMPDYDQPGVFFIAAIASSRGILAELGAESGVTNYQGNNNIMNEYEQTKLSLSNSGAGMMVNSAMTLAITNLAARFCEAGMARERGAGITRVLFPNVNLNATVAAGTFANQQALDDVISNLTNRFWQRLPNGAERERLNALANALRTVPNGTAQEHRDILVGLCTAVAGSLQASLSL